MLAAPSASSFRSFRILFMNRQVLVLQFATAKRFSHPKMNSSGNSLGTIVSARRSRAVALRLG